MRDRDEPIPPDENLYRWVACEDCHGDEVLPSAVDLQGTSVNREEYWPNPEEQLPDRSERNGLARVCEKDFPVDGMEFNRITYEFFTVDRPEEQNEAHAEIRTGRAPTNTLPNGDRWKGRKPPNRLVKSQLKASLAETMSLFKAPQDSSDKQVHLAIEK